MTQRLLGFSGYGRVGKDTCGHFLVTERNFARVAFADAVREFSLAIDPIIQGHQLRDPVRLSELVDAAGWEMAKTEPEVRRLLQRVGTEAGRKIIGPNVWLDVAMKKANDLLAMRTNGVPDLDGVVITDVRFPEEARAIENYGTVVRINRPNFGPVNNHPSETALDAWPFRRVIENDGTLDQLREKVLAL